MRDGEELLLKGIGQNDSLEGCFLLFVVLVVVGLLLLGRHNVDGLLESTKKRYRVHSVPWKTVPLIFFRPWSRWLRLLLKGSLPLIQGMHESIVDWDELKRKRGQGWIIGPYPTFGTATVLLSWLATTWRISMVVTWGGNANTFMPKTSLRVPASVPNT